MHGRVLRFSVWCDPQSEIDRILVCPFVQAKPPNDGQECEPHLCEAWIEVALRDVADTWLEYQLDCDIWNEAIDGTGFVLAGV